MDLLGRGAVDVYGSVTLDNDAVSGGDDDDDEATVGNSARFNKV